MGRDSKAYFVAGVMYCSLRTKFISESALAIKCAASLPSILLAAEPFERMQNFMDAAWSCYSIFYIHPTLSKTRNRFVLPPG